MVSDKDFHNAIRNDWSQNRKIEGLEKIEEVDIKQLLSLIQNLDSKLKYVHDPNKFNNHDKRIFLSFIKRINKVVDKIDILDENEMRLARIKPLLLYKSYLKNMYPTYLKATEKRNILLKKKYAIWLNIKRTLNVILMDKKRLAYNVTMGTLAVAEIPLALISIFIGGPGHMFMMGSEIKFKEWRVIFYKYTKSVIYQLEQIIQLDENVEAFQKAFLEMDFLAEKILDKAKDSVEMKQIEKDLPTEPMWEGFKL
jgi:hypothetical protein